MPAPRPSSSTRDRAADGARALIPLLLAVAPAATFAPPLERPLTVTVRETRESGGRVQRFSVTRRVTFSLRTGGYAATVETLAVDGTPGGTEALFVAAMRASVGTRMTVLLDAAGRVVDVTDRSALWERQVAAVAAGVTAGRPGRAATAETLLAPLRAADAGAQIRQLGGAVSALVDPELAARPALLSAKVTQPMGGAMLTGTESVAREGADAVRLERRLTGTGLAIVVRRVVDRRTGLLREARETRTIDAADSVSTIVRETLVS